ncbi:MAG: inositol monophosphatase [Bacteroidetes bacterium]|nr:inositol monophosphatase [Bacteroidota bacterium]
MVEKVVEIARTAGEVIREGFGKNFQVDFKTNETNLVTEIDKKAEEVIISYIQKEFPAHAILAEESGAKLNDSEYLWVIDPIDGTTNFAHGLPIFSVSIGVQKNGETICGIVYDVMMDRMYQAEKGGGAFLGDLKLKVSDGDNLKQSLLVTGFPYDIRENPRNIKELFSDFMMNSRGIRRLGSAAIDFCYIASGVFDGYWEYSLNPWDMAAGILLVQEAGGKVTNFTDETVNIYSKQILASNGKIHWQMMEIIKRNE